MSFDLPEKLYGVTKATRENPRNPGEINFDGIETEDEQAWGEVDLTFEAFVEAYAENPDEVEQTDDLSQDEKTEIASTSLIGNANAETFGDLVSYPIVNPATKNLNEAGLDAAASRVGATLSGDTMESAMDTIDTLNERHFEEEEGEAATQSKHKLEAPIVQKDSAKQIVTGPVLIPDEEDKAGDTVTKEQIEEKAHTFLKDYANIDIQHTLNNVAEPIESWILREDREYVVNGEVMHVPAGSWMLSSKVESDEVWDMVEKGVIRGYSIMAVKEAVLKSIDESNTDEVEKQLETAAKSGLIAEKDLKETTLEDLGDDYVVNAVSLVDNPSVPKAKFVSVKSENPEVSYKQIEGTLDERIQERKDAVADALREKLELDEDNYIWIKGLFEESVVFEISEPEGDFSFYQVRYNYGSTEGEAEIIGSPVPVEINEIIEPVTRSAVDELEAKVKQSSKKAEQKLEELREDSELAAKQFVLDYSEKAGLQSITGDKNIIDYSDDGQVEKEGKTLNNSNLNKLAEAQQMIEEVVEQGLEEREEETLETILSTDKSEGKEAVDMEPDELKSVVSEAVSEGVEKALESSEKEEAESDAEEESAEKSESEESSEEESAEKSEDEEGEEQEEDEVTKELREQVDELQNKLGKVEKANSQSRHIFGQDSTEKSEDSNDEDLSSNSDRDFFGRKKE